MAASTSLAFDLSGRVALVTGSTRGLGWAMARALAAAGATVVVSARHADDVARRASELTAEGMLASGLVLDATDPAAAAPALAEVERRHSKIDILVNNAGTIVRKPLLEHSDADWDSVLELDLSACFRLSREAARLMVPRRWGRIIMTSSVAGFVARPTIPGYVAAKAGIHGLVRALGVELAPTGVTVNAVAPGYFPSDANENVRADKRFYDWVCARTPAGRWGDPSELAGAVVFLASPAAAYCTGAILPVDGGLTAAM